MKPASAQTHQFPLDWQRCLDIKSGQIYFYNARTNKKSLGDPKASDQLETYNPAPMSLELELNLPCQSQVEHNKYKKHDYGTPSIHPNDHFMNRDAIKGQITKSPSWLTFEADEQEMVTAVCRKCYMLVMMSKSCPACPNCKFLHPLGLSSNAFDRGFEG
ncbi:hypothetical protein PHJA_001831300 [Phtheirospermum japonicum]|uniref:WW domain-containing protein n=1 Tax=Phtheirospermum japonicum TaxID=374723 RepID=A0A830CEY7_9LAMI|nr:hypothetical protein PHJA_001831300 [Phtheirospermum japonicum]